MSSTLRHEVVPILSSEQAKRMEEALFAGDEAKEWQAMTQAGQAVAVALLKDFQEIGGLPANAQLLVLVGKGHNGGDALLAAKFVLEKFSEARADVRLVFGEKKLRPLAARAWRELVQAASDRVATVRAPADRYDLCIDGIFGFQFRPPVDVAVAKLLKEVKALPVRLRAAVDLPSGLGTCESFHADFTYATGSVKAPLIDKANREHVGRVRYLDLGFFSSPVVSEESSAASDFVLTPAVLAPLRCLRSPLSDKRTYGHLFVAGGSRSFPGAVLMSVLAALKAGVGLVTAFVPESLAAAYAAQVPEAMWVAWPETPDGGLAMEGAYLLRERIGRATALLVGPGLGREGETLALVKDIVKNAEVPLVIDADALQPEIVCAGKSPRVLTPHEGEFARIAAGKELREFSKSAGAVTVLKSSSTQVSDGEGVHHSFHGGPVLARGGSGDLLAGIIGGLLAGGAKEPLAAVCRGVVWHGLAADELARARGQVAVRTTELLEFLPVVLRRDEDFNTKAQRSERTRRLGFEPQSARRA